MANTIRNDGSSALLNQEGMRARGTSLEEVRVNQTAKLAREKEENGVDLISIQPLVVSEAIEFLSPSDHADDLRLSVPDSANPFATPLGPTPIHISLRKAVARANSPVSKALIEQLQSGSVSFDEQSTERMRASLGRVNKMDRFLVQIERWVEHVQSRIVGQQQG
jgi:hypothetical protein